MTVAAFRTIPLRTEPAGVLRWRMLRLADGSLLRLAVLRRTGLRGGRTLAVARLVPVGRRRSNPFVWLTTKKDAAGLVRAIEQRGHVAEAYTIREGRRGVRGLYEVWDRGSAFSLYARPDDPLTEPELRALAERASTNPMEKHYRVTHRSGRQSVVRADSEEAVWDRHARFWRHDPVVKVEYLPHPTPAERAWARNPKESPTLRRTYVVSGRFGSIAFRRPVTDQDRARRLAVRLQSLGWSQVQIAPTLRALPRPRNPRRAARSGGKP